MRRGGRALIVIALVAASLVTVASPASADHQDALTHWGRGYAPLVSADCTNFGGTWCSTYTSYAESTWYNNGYPNGFRGGNAYQGCGQKGGWTLVCIVEQSTVQADCVNDRADGCTQNWYTFDPAWHLDHTYVEICRTCGKFGGGGGRYSVAELQSLTTHEYGHSIGLGHTAVVGSVMQPVFNVPSYPVGHDYQGLGTMYAQLKPYEELCNCQQSFTSPSRQYTVVFQASDGNLVEYGPTGSLWQSGTAWWGATRAVMQSDGNFVIYKANGSVLCATRTYNNPGAHIEVQNDGNLVIYTSGGAPIWARTWGSLCFWGG